MHKQEVKKQERKHDGSVNTDEITYAKMQLDMARVSRDPLRIALAEDALNDLLDRYRHTCHT